MKCGVFSLLFPGWLKKKGVFSLGETWGIRELCVGPSVGAAVGGLHSLQPRGLVPWGGRKLFPEFSQEFSDFHRPPFPPLENAEIQTLAPATVTIIAFCTLFTWTPEKQSWQASNDC